jgi:hypothetical protein
VLHFRSAGSGKSALGASDGVEPGTRLGRTQVGAVAPGPSGVAIDWPTQPVASSVAINSVAIRVQARLQITNKASSERGHRRSADRQPQSIRRTALLGPAEVAR